MLPAAWTVYCDVLRLVETVLFRTVDSIPRSRWSPAGVWARLCRSS